MPVKNSKLVWRQNYNCDVLPKHRWHLRHTRKTHPLNCSLSLQTLTHAPAETDSNNLITSQTYTRHCFHYRDTHDRREANPSCTWITIKTLSYLESAISGSQDWVNTAVQHETTGSTRMRRERTSVREREQREREKLWREGKESWERERECV